MSIKIAFLGDIVPGGVLTDKKVLSPEVDTYLRSFDLRVGNLECPLGNERFEFDKLKMNNPNLGNIVYALENSISKLKELNLDIVSLANNHIFDLSEKGLENTISILNENKIKNIGAGMNLNQAMKPCFIQVGNKNIAFFACWDMGMVAPHKATKKSAGVNNINLITLGKQIKEIRNSVDFIFILVHWGREHTIFPLPKDLLLAKQLINLGFDGIIGSHPHIIQPFMHYNSKPVFFSLGNTLFPDRYINTPRITVYPSEDQKKECKVITTKFPIVSELTYKKWQQHSYYGLIAEITIDNSGRVKSSYKMTKLNSENKIEFVSLLKGKIYIVNCYLISLLFHNNTLYLIFFKIIRLINFSFNFFSFKNDKK